MEIPTPLIPPELLTPTLTDSQKINLNVITLNTRVNEQQLDMDRVMKTLFLGNGTLPLVEQVRNLIDYTNNIKYWQRAVALALLGQTITFGAAVIVMFLKLYPLLLKISNQP
jgi:hypothetical protein